MNITKQMYTPKKINRHVHVHTVLHAIILLIVKMYCTMLCVSKNATVYTDSKQTNTAQIAVILLVHVKQKDKRRLQ